MAYGISIRRTVAGAIETTDREADIIGMHNPTTFVTKIPQTHSWLPIKDEKGIDHIFCDQCGITVPAELWMDVLRDNCETASDDEDFRNEYN